jgi:hypothetical protein
MLIIFKAGSALVFPASSSKITFCEASYKRDSLCHAFHIGHLLYQVVFQKRRMPE